MQPAIAQAQRCTAPRLWVCALVEKQENIFGSEENMTVSLLSAPSVRGERRSLPARVSKINHASKKMDNSLLQGQYIDFSQRREKSNFRCSYNIQHKKNKWF